MTNDDRSSFQPEKPHPETKGTGGTSRMVFIVAAAAAVTVVMILAIATPRLFGDGALRWVFTLGAGVLAFAVVAGVGFMRGSSRG